jgi:addiction module HigA family antidote
MAIDRRDLDAGLVDLSDVNGGEADIGPIHPGEILREEWLKPLGISAYRLAQDISVPPNRVTEILAGRRAISADTALRLGRYFGTDPMSWLNLQTRYDLEAAQGALAGRLENEVKPQAA